MPPEVAPLALGRSFTRMRSFSILIGSFSPLAVDEGVVTRSTVPLADRPTTSRPVAAQRSDRTDGDAGGGHVRPWPRRSVCSPKWKIDAASTASAPPSMTPVDQVVERADAAAGDHRARRTASVTARVSSRSKPSRGAVAVHRREQDLAGARAARPRSAHATASSPVGVRPPWVNTSKPRRRRAAGRRWRPRTHWAPNSRGDLADQLGPLDGGGVDRHLVGAGPQQPAGVVDRADAAADRERDEHLLGGAARRRRPSCRGRRTTR